MDDTHEPFDAYVNGVQINSGPWDFMVEFYLKVSSDQKEPPTLAGRVRMSPQHALVFARLLQRQVDGYQQTFGKISLPPKMYNDLGLEE